MRSTFVSNGLRSRDKVEVSEFFTSGRDGNLLNLLIISLFEEDFCSIRGGDGAIFRRKILHTRRCGWLRQSGIKCNYL